MADTALFEEARLGSLTLRNRVMVAPMTRVSAEPDGRVGPLMKDYYARFAEGGFGAVITEGVYTDRLFSQGYRNQPGMTSQSQSDSWKPIVRAVRENGTRIIMQMMHAGALSQFNMYRPVTKAPSAVRPKGEQMSFYHGSGLYPLPQAMTEDDIEDVKGGFVRAARFARAAGFDGVEIHGANGYLLDEFLTDYTNTRSDRYGGNAHGRSTLACEVAHAVRSAVGPEFVVGIRISQGKVNDFEHKWPEGRPAAQAIFSALATTGVDYIHTTEFRADQPAFDSSEDTLASLAKQYSGLPVIANGGLEDKARADGLIAHGDADFVSLGKGALANMDWPARAQRNDTIEPFDPALLNPIADLENARSLGLT